jgi:hypothetical protein
MLLLLLLVLPLPTQTLELTAIIWIGCLQEDAPLLLLLLLLLVLKCHFPLHHLISQHLSGLCLCEDAPLLLLLVLLCHFLLIKSYRICLDCLPL